MDTAKGVKNTCSSVPAKKEVLDRYNEKKQLFFIVSIVVFIMTLFLYSPNAETSFLPVTNFPCLVVFATFLGVAVFLLSTLFYIEFFTPPGSIPFPIFSQVLKSKYSASQHEISKGEYFDSNKDWGWHNDSTNPVSPIYHDTHKHY
jgi:hypothetical protein